MNAKISPKTKKESKVHFKTPQENNRFHAEIEDINQCQQNIEVFSDINNDLRNQYLKLEGTLDSVSKSLEKNTDWMTEFTSSLESKNAELENQIQKQKNLMDEITAIYFDLSQLGIDIKTNKEIDFPFIVSIAGQEFPVKKKTLNYQIGSIINNSSYFSDCHNIEDFTQICADLTNEVKELKAEQKTDQDDDGDYEKKIKKLLKYNQIEHAKIAAEIKMLLGEKDELIKKTQKHNAKFNSEQFLDDIDLF